MLRTQSNAQREAGSERYRGVLDCLRRLLAEEGVPGLCRGVDKKLTHCLDCLDRFTC